MNWLTRLFRNRREDPDERLNPSIPAGMFSNAVTVDLDNPPEWIRVVPVGDFPQHPNGAHTITRQHIDQMAANLVRFGSGLLFDVEHASLWGNSRAAGWSGEYEAREDGLYVRFPIWTPYGEPLVKNREYRMLSPVYRLDARDKRGQPIGARLYSVALTNTPYMDEGEVDPISNTNPPTQDTVMDRNKLIQILGLKADATDAEIEAAVTAAKSAATPPAPAPAPAPATPPAPAPAASGDGAATPANVADLEAKVNSLTQEVDRLKRGEKDDAEKLVDQAVADGKILPADRGIYLNSARADLAGTKARLDGIAKDAALPSKTKVNRTAPVPDADYAKRPTHDLVKNAVDHIRAQRG